MAKKRNKKKRKPQHRTKFAFLCTAPEFLTEYNEKLNEEVKADCWQDPKFNPRLTCIGCKYLETKGYK